MTQVTPTNEKHQARMRKKKQIMDAKIAHAVQERGVLILLKGNGKGKSSSAFGMLARTLGHGMRAGVVQFIKGRTETGEHLFFKRHPQVDWHLMGQGFTWETQDRAQDIQAAQAAWIVAHKMLANPDYHLLIFDEMSYMYKFGYLDVAPLVQALEQRPVHQHVVITGRTMATPLQAIADTISRVEDERHAFRLGVKAQPGIEF